MLTEDATRFTTLLSSRVAERRIEGIQGLSHLKQWSAEEAVLARLADPDPRVKSEAVSALIRLGTAKSIPALIALLGDPSWELRRNVWLGLTRMTAQAFTETGGIEWREWWAGGSPDAKADALLAAARKTAHPSPPNTAQPPDTAALIRRANRGGRSRPVPGAPAHPERRAAFRALRHLAAPAHEAALLEFLQTPQTPPLDVEERGFICEALERIGSARSIRVLAGQHIDAAAWALGRIGGREAEAALLRFPKTLTALLALDRLHSTNAGPLLPELVGQMGQITYRGQPDDVMNEELQPIQRVGANLIRRAGHAPVFIERVIQELEETTRPPIPHGPRPAAPAEWDGLFRAMRSELKPGFVREDGTTTSQPVVAMCYTATDPALAKRLMPLLRHPAYVIRVYIAFTLGRLHATETLPAIVEIIREGYPFSDSVALASGKHFEQSQTVRWRGFLCMALGRLGGDGARQALETFAADPAQPRDVRYSAVTGLGFIASPKSLPVLERVAGGDIIWLVRDEARQVAEKTRILQQETRP